MFCQGNIEGCEAEEGLCPVCRDVVACSEHGHIDAGAISGCLYERQGFRQRVPHETGHMTLPNGNLIVYMSDKSRRIIRTIEIQHKDGTVSYNFQTEEA